MRTPHPLLREKNGSVNQFAKIGKLCSESTVIKKFSIIAEVPTITAFVAAFDAKAFNCTELLESYLAGGNRIINCHRQTNRNRPNWNIWHNTWSTLFIRITSVFSYLYCKKKHTAPIWYAGGIKTLKHNLRTTLQLSYHGCKYLTHTSKTPHVKRTQMVATVRFTIRVTSLPRWNKQGINICDWFLAYYCGVKLLEYRYAQVWNIAKRRKQSPIGWFL